MKRLLISFLISLAALPVWAQSDNLGRLFFTPQQRAALDRERLLGFSQRPSSLDGDASYTFNGEVRRSSGKNTRWINGVPVTTATRKPEVAADGNSVIMFYNPKPQAPGENGDMIELNITQAGRKIATGYTVDVPEGYVCDVVVGTDVVASVQGRGEAELSVLLTSRGPARHVGAGYEIAKLTLRRMARLTAKVD